jgi:hypothetical protein
MSNLGKLHKQTPKNRGKLISKHSSKESTVLTYKDTDFCQTTVGTTNVDCKLSQVTSTNPSDQCHEH